MKILKKVIILIFILIIIFIGVYALSIAGIKSKNDSTCYHLTIYELSTDKILEDWYGSEIYIDDTNNEFIDFYKNDGQGGIEYRHLLKNRIRYVLEEEDVKEE